MFSIIGSAGVTIDRMIYLHGKLNGTSNAFKNHEEREARADFTFAILLLWTAVFSLYHILVSINSVFIA